MAGFGRCERIIAARGESRDMEIAIGVADRREGLVAANGEGYPGEGLAGEGDAAAEVEAVEPRALDDEIIWTDLAAGIVVEDAQFRLAQAEIARFEADGEGGGAETRDQGVGRGDEGEVGGLGARDIHDGIAGEQQVAVIVVDDGIGEFLGPGNRHIAEIRVVPDRGRGVAVADIVAVAGDADLRISLQRGEGAATVIGRTLGIGGIGAVIVECVGRQPGDSGIKIADARAVIRVVIGESRQMIRGIAEAFCRNRIAVIGGNIATKTT